MLNQYKFSYLMMINLMSYIFKSYLMSYPAPKNIGYFWNFGVLSIFFFFIQFMSGIFLAMFYTPHIEYAFFSIEYMMNDVNFGWLISYIHANGASFFFLVVYIHLLRGIYYSSYKFPSTNLWISGLLMYFLLMATAFLGYVLPWGQMSYWAATVMTNFMTVIPIMGEDLMYWVWGGYSINNATLNSFFCLHFLLPFIIMLAIIFHMVLLHQVGSSNELKLVTNINNKISFFPYFIIKDLFSIFIILLLFMLMFFFFPEMFNHAINYIPSNPKSTPNHIVPEWYFLPFYAILSCILNKMYGLMVMFLSMMMLFFFSMFDSENINLKKNNTYNLFFFWFFVFNFFFLGFLGSQSTDYPCIELSLFCTIFHFFYCMIYMPFMNNMEKYFFMKFFFMKKKKKKKFWEKMFLSIKKFISVFMEWSLSALANSPYFFLKKKKKILKNMYLKKMFSFIKEYIFYYFFWSLSSYVMGRIYFMSKIYKLRKCNKRRSHPMRRWRW